MLFHAMPTINAIRPHALPALFGRRGPRTVVGSRVWKTRRCSIGLTPPEGAGSGDRPVGRKEGADRNSDHVVDPLVARRLAGIEEERL
jgi:hypothetical protein